MGAALVSSLILALAVLNDHYGTELRTGTDNDRRKREHLLTQFLLGLCAAAWLAWTPVLLTGRTDPTVFTVWSTIMVVVVTLLVAFDGSRQSHFSSERSPKCPR